VVYNVSMTEINKIHCLFTAMETNENNKFNFQYLTSKEKSQLKQRINTSVSKYTTRRRRFRFGIAAMAAVLVLLVAITFGNGGFSTPSEMEQVVKSLSEQPNSDEIQLLLSDDERINISEEKASISYSEAGNEVRVGNKKSYQQSSSEAGKTTYNTLIVPFGRRSDLKLSDGTKVWLNSGSKLIFPSSFQNDKREVYLEGEAIFEVSHNKNKPFFVTSENHSIEVLGTVFNISNYEDDGFISTVLKSGSVKINYESGYLFKTSNSKIIKPNQMAIFEKNQGVVATSNVKVAPYFSWRDGVFTFKNDDLKSIMKKISRYYNVEIEIQDENLAKDRFSGYLDVKDDIESVMQTIKETETSDFNYKRIDQNKIIIDKILE